MAYQSPIEGRRVNIRANASSAIDNNIVTLASGTNTSLSQSGGTITFNQSTSFLIAQLSTDQTSNLGALDHIKFDTVVSSSGSSISLDTSTTYTTTIGAASIGRFTLASGKKYALVGQLMDTDYDPTTGQLVIFGWHDATNNAGLGGAGANEKWNTSSWLGCTAQAFITTSATTLVGLAFVTNNGMTRVGHASSGRPGAMAIIYEIR